MIRYVVRLAAVFAITLLLLAGTLLFLCGTQTGTRWLVGTAGPYLPEQLETGSVSGTLLGGLRAQGLRWTDSAVRVSVRELELSIALRPLFKRRLSIRKLDVRGIDVALLQSDEPTASEGPFEVDLPLTVEILESSLRDIVITRNDLSRRIDEIRLVSRLGGSRLRVTRFDVAADWLETSLTGEGRLQPPYSLQVQLAWRFVAAAEAEYAGRLEVSGRIDDYAVQHTLEAPFAVATQGVVAYRDGDLRADLANRWEELGIVAGGSNIRSRDGRLRISGSTSQYDVRADTLLEIDDWPSSHVDLDASGDLGRLRVASLGIDSDRGRLMTSGDFAWSPAISWDVAFDASGLDPSLLNAALSGSLELRGTSAGELRDGRPGMRVDLLRIDGTFNEQPVDGTAAATIGGEVANIEMADIRIGENRLEARGRVGGDNDLNVVVSVPRLGTLVTEASGRLDGDLRVRGGAGDLSISGNASGTALAWRGYHAEALDARVALSGGGDLELNIEAKLPGYERYVADTAELSLLGSRENHTLQVAIRAPGSNLDVGVGGSYADGRWDGSIRTLNLAADRLGNWASGAAVDLELAASGFAIDRLCLDDSRSAGRACIRASWAEGAPLDFDLSVDELPLTLLPLALPSGVEVAGTARIGARGRMQPGLLNGSASVDVTNTRFSTDYEGETVTATFEEGILTANVSDNRLAAELRVKLSDEFGNVEGALGMADVFDRQSAIDGMATLDVDDLSIFPILLPSVTNTSGRIEGSVAISGSASTPELTGAVALRDGAFAVRRGGISVTQVNIELRQREPGQLGITGSAHSGQGSVNIDGSTEFGANGELRAGIDIEGRDFELIRLPDWRVAASPDVSVSMDGSKATVTGNVVIPVANIAIDTLPETAERTSPDAVVHLAETIDDPVRRRIDVNVNAELGDKVRVKAFGLTTGLSGAVNIKGGTHAPYVGSGRLLLQDGRYEAYGQSLTIERGALIFNGPLNNPNLDVRAVRPARDVIAGVHLTGTPRQLSSTVFSEPPLPDAEALSYLLTGRPLASASSGEGEMLNKAAFALGLSQAGAIASQVQGRLGLDSLTVAGGADDSQIVAGKQINDRLFVEYGYGLVDKLGRLLLRYQLSQRLVIESTSGVSNTVDLVYSVKKQ